MYLENRNRITLDEEGVHHKLLPKGSYSPRFTPQGLVLYRLPKFTSPKTVFGNAKERAEFIIKSHKEVGKLGLLLEGAKGSGKSMLASMIAEYSPHPAIIVDKSIHIEGIHELYKMSASTGQAYVFVFDEYEKFFDREDQQKMLSIFDGPLQHNCLTIFCTNNPINQYLYNRLKRIRYRYSYSFLSTEETKEVLSHLIPDNEDVVHSIAAKMMLFPATYDILTVIAKDWHRGMSIEQIFEVVNLEPSKVYYRIRIDDPNVKGHFYIHTTNNIFAEKDIYFTTSALFRWKKGDKSQKGLEFRNYPVDIQLKNRKIKFDGNTITLVSNGVTYTINKASNPE
jgi:hypothetical protein